MFRNTLTANDKYPFRDLQNSASPNQMQLSLKLKTFSDNFVPFLESTSDFKDFEKKMIVMATLLRNFQAVKDLV